MNDDDFKKKKKRLEQIALNIEDKQKGFDKLIEEGIKILELSEREYNNTINTAEIKLTKKRKDIILEAGRYLENNLEIVKNNDKHQICRTIKDVLKEKYNGKINPTLIWYYCPADWKSEGLSDVGRKGGLTTQGLKNAKNLSENLNTFSTETEPLTEYESQYVEVHDQKVYHNDLVEKLIDYYLGLTKEEKTHIINKTPKGSDYQKALIEKARDNMLRIAKRLNDTDIGPNLDDIRFLSKIHNAYTDIVYGELQKRKENRSMMTT